MRARILAIVILILFLVIPITLYWYLTTQKIASISITVPSGNEFTVKLVGTFGLDGLPLADKMLSYDKNCFNTCTITPIIPAKYKLILTSKDKITIEDSIVINAGLALDKSFDLISNIVFSLTGSLNKDIFLADKLIQNAQDNNIGQYRAIGIDIRNRFWVIRSNGEASQIGILTMDKFSPIKNLNIPAVEPRLDDTKSVIIILAGNDHFIFMPVDLSEEKEITLNSAMDIHSVVPGENWKIKTQLASFELRGERLIEDIRFSDSIDISPEMRIGYIDKNDTKKLLLSNFPLGKSLLIRLDRKTGTSVVINNDVQIESLFYFNKKPAYIDAGGNIFSLDSYK